MERAAIVTLQKVGWTGRDIAQVIKCSENTVSLWVNRWRDQHSVADAERSGRPRLIDEDTSQAIDDDSCEHKTAEPKDIRRELQLPVSARAIRRELHSIGLFSHVQREEHELTERHSAPSRVRQSVPQLDGRPMGASSSATSVTSISAITVAYTCSVPSEHHTTRSICMRPRSCTARCRFGAASAQRG
jgi:transposase